MRQIPDSDRSYTEINLEEVPTDPDHISISKHENS